MTTGFPAKIVSGGQTGVDRAALDVARELGLAAGGWCPKGRLAEDGVIPARYRLRQTASADYAERTRLNVVDSDATLVLTRGPASDGTALTIALAEACRRPLKVIDLAAPAEPGAVRAWLARARVRVLNVAGPRESSAPGIHGEAFRFLKAVLTAPRS